MLLFFAMLDYSKPFIVEIDASGKAIGDVLMQQGHTITYISRSLSPRHQAMFVYDGKLLALIFSITKWSYYLLGRKKIYCQDISEGFKI